MEILETAYSNIKEAKVDRLALSITKLKMFESCAFRYYLKFIKKVKVDKRDYNPIYFKKGQFAHKYIDSKIKGVDCLFNSTTLTDKDKEDIASQCDIILKDDFVKSLLSMKHESEIPFQINFNLENSSIQVEKKYSRKADFSGYVDFLGIDGDTLYVIDWKTGNIPTETNEIYEQVLLYAKAMLEIYGSFKKVVVGYVYIDHQEKLIKEVTPEIIDSLLADLMGRGLKIPRSTQEKDFLPNTGKACERCEYGEAGNGACKHKFIK